MVNKAHYFCEQYSSLQRFISLYFQINTIMKLQPTTVLEIGVGNKVVYNYLKNTNIKVTGGDFDKNLEPDVFLDLTDLPLPFSNDSFDCITACEVLEHIPFSVFFDALLELKRVSRRYVVISLPYITLNTYGFLKPFSTLPPFYFMIRCCEAFFTSKTITPEHEWEMGRKGYSKNIIKNAINKAGLVIQNEFTPFLNPCHYFFVLEKERMCNLNIKRFSKESADESKLGLHAE